MATVTVFNGRIVVSWSPIGKARQVVLKCRRASLESYRELTGLYYLADVEDAKADFIDYLSTLLDQFTKIRRMGHDVTFYENPRAAWDDWSRDLYPALVELEA